MPPSDFWIFKALTVGPVQSGAAVAELPLFDVAAGNDEEVPGRNWASATRATIAARQTRSVRRDPIRPCGRQKRPGLEGGRGPSYRFPAAWARKPAIRAVCVRTSWAEAARRAASLGAGRAAALSRAEAMPATSS